MKKKILVLICFLQTILLVGFAVEYKPFDSGHAADDHIFINMNSKSSFYEPEVLVKSSKQGSVCRILRSDFDFCPFCGSGPIEDGVCQECGHILTNGETGSIGTEGAPVVDSLWLFFFFIIIYWLAQKKLTIKYKN